MYKYPVTLVYLLLFSGLAAQSPVQHKHCYDNDSLLQVLDYRKKSESSLVLLENKNNLVPLINLDTLKIACLSVGTSAPNFFGAMLENYAAVDQFMLRPGFTGVDSDSLLKKLGKYNLIIAGIHSLPTDTAISGSLWRFLTIHKSSLVVCFGADTFVNRICCFPKPAGLIYVPFNDKVNQELSAQAIFGGIALSGKLFSDLGNCYTKGYGISTGHPVRLKYTMAEEAGLNSLHLTHVIDSIVNNALEIKAFPGCNVLIAKNGKVVFHKSYGYHTFDGYIAAGKNDIYDLASVTKVTAALPAIMKLVDDQKLNVDERFSVYWTDWKQSAFHRSGKEDITVRELLAHQAGLTPYIPFYKQSMKKGTLKNRWYRAEAGGKYNLAVAPGLYLRDNFRNKVYRSIRLSPLSKKGRYVYSDLFFILVPELVSSLSGVVFSGFLDSCFYKPLGANSFAFRPWEKFQACSIVPTETDNYFRKRQLQGSVHDESAAVLGGISGNAGLFASANDLAKLLQMYLQKGEYGGRRYLQTCTLDEFNRVQYPANHNRRGLGFDKPLTGNDSLDINNAYPAPEASAESYGHSGYTGTFFWVDPVHQLVYIFLSNRVFPTRNNTLLSDLNIRTKIQQAIYNEIEAGKVRPGSTEY